jgi:DNA-binding NarL/FixJ family response regulator
LVTGPSGVGRTTFLARTGEELTRRGWQVSTLRFTPERDILPSKLTVSPPPSRPGGGSTALLQLPRPGRAGTPWAWIGPVVGARRSAEVAGSAAAAAAAPLLRGGANTALLIDDAQWIDPDSLAVLEALVRKLAGGPALCFCAVRTPVPAAGAFEGPAKIRDLRRDGLLHSVRLRPLSTMEITRRTTDTLLAAPDPNLVSELNRISRGIPGALDDATEALRLSGSIQVTDRRAYLVRDTDLTSPPSRSRFVREVRDLGPDLWCAAKAAAILAPLGEAVPRLVAEALDRTEPEALALLDALRRAGVLHSGRAGRSWRFTIPLVASALKAALGPFERRRLAANAVTAIWTGRATSSDPDYLADRIVDAGGLVDPQRALGDLLNHAVAVDEDQAEQAVRWLGAAVDLAEDRAQRALVLLTHTAMCHLRGDHEQSLRGAQTLLNDLADSLSADAVQEVQVMAVCALSGLGDTEALREVIEQRRKWAGDDAHRTVTRALACGMLDRWADADALLTQHSRSWRRGSETSVMLGGLLSTLAKLWTGQTGPFEHSLADRAKWPLRQVKRHHTDQVNSHLTALLVTGDLRGAERFLADEDLPVERLRLRDRAMIAVMQGRFGHAEELGRRGTATPASRGHDPDSAGVHQLLAAALVAQGKLATARELLTAARAEVPLLGHLLVAADALLDRALGESAGAASKIRETLGHCAEQGLLAGTEVFWAELADLALHAGDRAEAVRCLSAVEALAERMPTSRTLAQAKLLRAIVTKDRDAAADCLRLVRERGQPFELALVIERLANHEVCDPKLLTEAYDLLGDLDALLYRAWLRNLMRTHNVAVPGRRETVTENERLLAMLAAEGLSNKQLAMALRTTEKSVEGRLSRLFTRTGYRSRIELSTAMLNGDYHAL